MKRLLGVTALGFLLIWLAPFLHWYGTYVLVWVVNEVLTNDALQFVLFLAIGLSLGFLYGQFVLKRRPAR